MNTLNLLEIYGSLTKTGFTSLVSYKKVALEKFTYIFVFFSKNKFVKRTIGIPCFYKHFQKFVGVFGVTVLTQLANAI